jgi:hypothetical protein
MPQRLLLLASSGAEQPVRSPTFLLAEREMLPWAAQKDQEVCFLGMFTKKCIKMEDEFFNNQKTVANVESKCPWYPYDQTLPVTIGPRPHSTQVANNILNSPNGPNGPKRCLTSDALFDRSHFWLMGPSLFGPG